MVLEIISFILIISQLFFTVIAAMYFYLTLKSQYGSKPAKKPEYKKEAQRLYKMRCVRLTEPLSEKTRPEEINQIIGQDKGIKALRAALCGENPQHILIYGPPGVGKTAAARLILEEAKNNKKSPFKSNAKFVELDATTLQFDERSIADPLIGSVHDPIYQGAGSFGSAGIPQPKEGAVTKAHGGVLFIDEIGELHPIQMNKLLKVLEDRKVFFTSSYYNSDDKNIPGYIKDIFECGLPADFRLIGATTRSPEEIPPALRSRCTEIYFDSLNEDEIELIGENACANLGVNFENGVLNTLSKYCSNGRSAVNLIQAAYSYAENENRFFIKKADLEQAIQMSRLIPKYIKKINASPEIGYVNALGVSGFEGIMLGLEAYVKKASPNEESVIKITGVANEQIIKNKNGSIKRKSTVRESVENALTLINAITSIDYKDYNIHLNFPGAIPIDGPSAGAAIFTALYSSFFDLYIDNKTAITGEISIKGNILPVGGIKEKLDAAAQAGIKTVIMPKSNMQENFNKTNINIIPVENINQLIEAVFEQQIFNNSNIGLSSDSFLDLA